MGGTDTVTFVLAPAITASLAIKLEAISAVNKGAVNEVHWTSVSEETGDTYQVESSPNGSSFIALDTVPGKAINGGNYTYIDQSPVSGTNYYRLKFLNADGTSGYSKIVSAVKKDVFGVSVFPNPAKSELTIQCNGETSGTATITLYDIAGKQYSNTKMSGPQTKVSLSGLPAGLYLVRYQDAQHRESFTVIKE
jgi:hypothetical protein